MITDYRFAECIVTLRAGRKGESVIRAASPRENSDVSGGGIVYLDAPKIYQETKNSCQMSLHALALRKGPSVNTLTGKFHFLDIPYR